MSASTVVGVAELPEAIRAADTLERVDYADHFTVQVPDAADRTPEQWARAVIEETPIGRRARVFWHLLGLRLGPPGSQDHVQGWRIADRGDDWIRTETSAWFATAHAVCQVDDDQVSVALFLRYDHPLAPLVWAPVGVLHRRGLPLMLRQAVRL